MNAKRKGQPEGAETGLPSKQAVLDFIQSSPVKVGKREIARAFNIKGADRIELKRLLKELAEEGHIAGTRRRLMGAGRLPPVTVVAVAGRDEHGEYFALPLPWDEAEHGPPPRILMTAGRRAAAPEPGIGDQVLVRIEAADPSSTGGYGYVARPIKRLPRERLHRLGIFRARDRGGVIEPIDKKQLREWPVDRHDSADTEDGELVRFEVMRTGRFGPPRVRVAERLGNPEGQRAVSLIAIENYGLRDAFPDAVDAELRTLPVPDPAGREDLRHLPLITIDPEDARDHDDAVWAAPDPDPGNRGGFAVIVAIADVAYYVRSGSATDREARQRGNSVYFPDRVVPMLPEALSNDLCSLREGEDRPCLAVRMTFDGAGRKTGHCFMRAMMRSAAKLAYGQAQAAIDGHGDARAAPLVEPVLRPLWNAYAALRAARDARGPLDLDLPERKIVLDDAGRVAAITVPERLDAHRLIEEFMIQANVAAAETLEAAKSPLIYRVHDAPSREKVTALNDFLVTIGLKLPRAGVMKPDQFNRILARARGSEFTELVNEVVLRTQAQAEYNPGNFGHFGLNLRRYAHFTSPIRRYADLVVHRALIRSLGLGPGGLSDAEAAALAETAEHISQAERRAMAAERETADRLVAMHLAGQVGARFAGRISGVVRAGLFVRLDHTGADGFVPAATIGGDYYRYQEADHALIGERGGAVYRLGDPVEVRLVEAFPAAGALRFQLLSEGRQDPRLSRGRRGGAQRVRQPHRRRR